MSKQKLATLIVIQIIVKIKKEVKKADRNELVLVIVSFNLFQFFRSEKCKSHILNDPPCHFSYCSPQNDLQTKLISILYYIPTEKKRYNVNVHILVSILYYIPTCTCGVNRQFASCLSLRVPLQSSSYIQISFIYM